jgi:Protein of unknown function DUF262/Protein of unknown function (DUF1524)
MPNNKKFTTELLGIGELIKSKRIVVPKYQRAFAWEEEEVGEFFDDIVKAMQDDETEYFVGPIVLTHTDNRFSVVDGQQRLASTVLLLAVLRDYFIVNEDDKRAGLIGDCIQSVDIRSKEYEMQFSMSSNDDEYFHELVSSKPGDDYPEPSRLSHTRLLNACALLDTRLGEYAEQSSNSEEDLLDLFEYILDSVIAIIVTAPDEANAFLIFETLNDRGLDLAPSDLLKNYLFLQSGTRMDTTQAHWVKMQSAFESAGNEELVVDYIRQKWSSGNGLTRERELYSRIKSEITGKTKAVSFASQLGESASAYQALLNPSHTIWANYPQRTQRNIAVLKLLNITRVRPLLLSALDKFSETEFDKTMHLVVSWTIRYMIAGGLGAGSLEEKYCEQAVLINAGTITNAKQLRDSMSSVVANDDVFETSFSTKSISKKPFARYLLSALESHMRSEEGLNELSIIEYVDKVNLEHVLPERPSAGWEIQEELHRSYSKRIGNMTLLGSDVNRDIGNTTIDEKLQAYSESELKINAELVERIGKPAKWDIPEIEERQVELARMAPKVWHTKFS